MTAIISSQTPSDINGVCIAHDGFGSSRSFDCNNTSSGVILFAGEQSRVMAFYAPTLGPAPRLIMNLIYYYYYHSFCSYYTTVVVAYLVMVVPLF